MHRDRGDDQNATCRLNIEHFRYHHVAVCPRVEQIQRDGVRRPDDAGMARQEQRV